MLTSDALLFIFAVVLVLGLALPKNKLVGITLLIALSLSLIAGVKDYTEGMYVGIFVAMIGTFLMMFFSQDKNQNSFRNFRSWVK